MHLFYCSDINGEVYTFSEEESKHCIRVLRLKAGDEVHLTDGKGQLFSCRLVGDHPKRCTAEIISVARSEKRGATSLHVAIAPTKNIERFEWFLEKATEIGIDEITPLVCARSERKTVNHDRMERILVSALKQSLKSWLPILNETTGFEDFIKRSHSGNKFIAFCDQERAPHLRAVFTPGIMHTVLIGPEGDFSQEEVNFAISRGFKPVSLGDSRLRTETAGVVTCCFLME
jgi:16S rRNA (uracil1498-N3)-methyltransferase